MVLVLGVKVVFGAKAGSFGSAFGWMAVVLVFNAAAVCGAKAGNFDSVFG